MINITDKSSCCGCTACVNVCPVQCIVMRRDRKEGFDYPVANPDLCIGCGRCDDVCPMQNPAPERSPIKVLATYSHEYREGSTSGGIFPMVAGAVLSEGGTVYAAAMNDEMKVEHVEAEDIEGLDRQRGSKYVQSELYSAFEEIRDYLSEGRKVLFAGTPCQVAGLLSCLGERYENLLTIDLACHGVPGPGLWEKYVSALERKLDGKLEEVRFRDKSRSWRHFDFRVAVTRPDGKVMHHSVPFMKDPYMALFIQNMTLRPSCYSCRAKNGRSGSDLTLADFWGACDVMPENDDDRGISLVLVNSRKGMDMIKDADIFVKETDISAANLRNSGFKGEIEVPQRREEFFTGMHSAPDLYEYMSGFVVRKSWFRRKMSKLRKILSEIMGGGSR